MVVGERCPRRAPDVPRVHAAQRALDRSQTPRRVVGMTPRARVPRTGDAELDQQLREILEELDVEQDRDVLFEVLVSAVRLAQDHADRLDLKITSATLKEMRTAFRAFAPYRNVPKVTIFGSARTHGTRSASP